ncbi:phosphatase PAP2 family protein [Arthrobacter sp. NyZ413]|uniref:phosphatase PAP2 family protein n=1 Tax=Arthrobacter sp. NyZ413 TaxID=3144669 RepID=UPI002BBE75E9|nr:phosphatase PAP2 family protein [Arthrobacter sp.]
MPLPVNRNASPEGRVSAVVRERVPLLPQPKYWLLWAIVLSAVVLAIGFTVKTVPGVTTSELGVDQDLSLHHIAALTALAMTINTLFGPVGGACVIFVIALYLFAVRKSLVRTIMFVLVACSGWAASEVFKLIVARHRPNPALLFDPLAPETGSNSFPSGHTSFAVALAFALYFLVRGTRWATFTAWAGAVVAVVVAWSRLYVGVHYPSDVTASFFAATAAVIAMAGLWNRYAPRVLERRPLGSAEGDAAVQDATPGLAIADGTTEGRGA